MNISIVLSFRNEEETIDELIKRLHTSLSPLKIEYEFIFVNDLSTDKSLDILKKLQKNDGCIKIINMSRNFGVSQCVLAGMKYSSGDAVVYMDTDLQDPPELIPELVQKWKDGANVVYTTRITRVGENPIKMWITRMAYRVLKLFSEIELPLNSGDFKLLDRRAVDELLQLNEKDPFLRGLVGWVGFKQVQVLYHREERFAGKTHYPLFGIGPLKAFIDGLTSFSLAPLTVSLLIGFIVSVGSFLYLIIIIVMKLLNLILPGLSAIMAIILFLGGIQLFTIGILGLYIGRIYNESKNRPNYIIESTFGFGDENNAIDNESDC